MMRVCIYILPAVSPPHLSTPDPTPLLVQIYLEKGRHSMDINKTWPTNFSTQKFQLGKC